MMMCNDVTGSVSIIQARKAFIFLYFSSGSALFEVGIWYFILRSIMECPTENGTGSKLLMHAFIFCIKNLNPGRRKDFRTDISWLWDNGIIVGGQKCYHFASEFNKITSSSVWKLISHVSSFVAFVFSCNRFEQVKPWPRWNSPMDDDLSGYSDSQDVHLKLWWIIRNSIQLCNR